MARYSLRSTARQLRVRVLTTIGILAAIVVTWWMKVEDARNPDAPPQVAFGEPVGVGRAVFTPQKLTIEPGSEQGERKLVLVGQLENVTSSSQRDVFGFPGGLPWSAP